MSKDFISGMCNIGGEVYIIGGAVRNIIYNKLFKTFIPVKDRDLLVRNLEQNKLIKCLKTYGSVKEVGEKFGVIKFIPNCNNNFGTIDIALPRNEISTGPGYKDFQIKSEYNLPLEEDL